MCQGTPPEESIVPEGQAGAYRSPRSSRHPDPVTPGEGDSSGSGELYVPEAPVRAGKSDLRHNADLRAFPWPETRLASRTAWAGPGASGEEPQALQNSGLH